MAILSEVYFVYVDTDWSIDQTFGACSTIFHLALSHSLADPTSSTQQTLPSPKPSLSSPWASHFPNSVPDAAVRLPFTSSSSKVSSLARRSTSPEGARPVD